MCILAGFEPVLSTMLPLLEYIFSRLYRPNNNDTTIVRINAARTTTNPAIQTQTQTPETNPAIQTQTLETNPAIQIQTQTLEPNPAIQIQTQTQDTSPDRGDKPC
jgi:hypothetical protein